MRRAFLGLVLLAGCSSKQDAAPGGCPSGTTSFQGNCVPTLEDCDEQSVPKLGGGCTKVGVIDCAAGFAGDGLGGCQPILPAMPCGPGTRALPGETTCTELVDCGTDPYGSPPGDHVLYVDEKVPAGGDGSRDKPFGAFGDAFDAAKDGDTVAFAAGRYQSGSVSKALTLWGRCPQQVSFVGSGGAGVAAIFLAAKVKLARVAITGDGIGLGVDGAQGVEIENVWIHDVAADGVWIQVPRTDASVTLRNVLVEKVNDTGIGAYGATLTLDRTVVRDVGPADDKDRGMCVSLESNLERKKPGTGTITNSLLERCHDSGITAFGSDVTVEKTLVRDILAKQNDKTFGTGVAVLRDDAIKRSSTAVLRDLVLSNTTAAGVYVQTSSARLEHVSVVDTHPQVSDKKVGAALYGAQGGTFEVFDSYFARNHHVALLFTGNAHIERSIVRDVTPDDAGAGGIGVASVPLKVDSNLQLDVIDSAVLHTQGAAIAFLGASGSVRGSHIRDVLRGTGGFGDGISAEPWNQLDFGETWVPSHVTVDSTLVTQASRAGAFVLADCSMTLTTSVLRCNGIDLTFSALRTRGVPGTLGIVDDGGGNLCGCASPSECLGQQSELEPISLAP
ncbi:MAG: right-handed parallel beta-helix repeat-containing protein [Polyangiales bacterium]